MPELSTEVEEGYASDALDPRGTTIDKKTGVKREKWGQTQNIKIPVKSP
jgi:hypothetical protein